MLGVRTERQDREKEFRSSPAGSDGQYLTRTYTGPGVVHRAWHVMLHQIPTAALENGGHFPCCLAVTECSEERLRVAELKETLGIPFVQ